MLKTAAKTATKAPGGAYLPRQVREKKEGVGRWSRPAPSTSTKINATLGNKELSVPEKTFMDYDWATLKLAKTTKWPGTDPFSGIGQEPNMLA